MTRAQISRRLPLLFLVLAVVAAGLSCHLYRRASELLERAQAITANLPVPKPKKNSIFHAPVGGCPAGTRLRRGFFEFRGKPVDACENPGGDGTIDVLRPGEGFHVEMLELVAPEGVKL